METQKKSQFRSSHLMMSLVVVFVAIAYSSSQAVEFNYLGSTLLGGVNGVAVQGNYAYCAVQSGLLVLDISQPSAPVFVSELFIAPSQIHVPFRGHGEDIAVAGSYAYLCFGTDGLQVIDISNPGDPVLIGQCQTPTEITGVTMDGNYACLYGGALYVVDISNPGQPVIIGTNEGGGEIFQVSISGLTAYVACDWGFKSVDISDRAHPVMTWQDPELKYHASGVVLRGYYAYVAYNDSTISVFYVSVPETAHLVGSYYVPAERLPMLAQGDYAYLLGETELRIVDISNPLFVHLVSSVSLSGWRAYNLFVSGNYAYVAVTDFSLDIVDISNPSQPFMAGSYPAPPRISNVKLHGSYAFVTDYSRGFYVLDISNPYDPVIISSIDTLGLTMEPYPLGNYLYVASTTNGLRIYDISDVQNISLVGSCATTDQACDISIQGNYAYVADFQGGLQMINIEDPQNPAVVGGYISSAAWAVVVKDTLAYVADFYGGLLILNVSDPTNPALVSRTPMTNGAFNLKVRGNYAYVAGERCYWSYDWGSLSIFDVSNPAIPIMVGNIAFDEYGSVDDVELFHGWAFLAYWNGGLRVVDVTNPSSPELIGAYETSGYPVGLAVTDGLVYLADWSSLTILSFDSGSRPPCAAYVVGDVNGNGRFDGVDVIFSVNYFKGGTSPLYRCECTPDNAWYVAGDVNASCCFNGVDVTYMVSYLKGGPVPRPCPNCPPTSR